MEIRIDEKMVQETLDSATTSGIKNAFEGYSVRSVLEKAISESVIPSVMATAIESAASTIDLGKLSQSLAEEIAKSVTRGVQAVIRETMTNILLDLKRIPDYDREKRDKARLEILSTVFGSNK